MNEAASDICLSESEVVVLNAVLHELTDRADFAALVPNEADRQAIHNLVCLLEREDLVAFLADYEQRLSEARERVLPAR